MSRRKQDEARIVLTEPVNDSNALKLYRAGFDVDGAMYHNVGHSQGPMLEPGDYMLVEFRDGSVMAAVIDRLGSEWTPCVEAK